MTYQVVSGTPGLARTHAAIVLMPSTVSAKNETRG